MTVASSEVGWPAVLTVRPCTVKALWMPTRAMPRGRMMGLARISLVPIRGTCSLYSR